MVLPLWPRGGKEDACFSLRFDDDVDIDVPCGQHQLMPAAPVLSYRTLSVNAHCRALMKTFLLLVHAESGHHQLSGNLHLS